MLVGYKSKNHPNQTKNRGPDHDADDRALPGSDFESLNARFRFTVDAAASPHNTKCERFWSIEDNGLDQPWGGERVYCNPPFSGIAPWVKKAWSERTAELVVMLLPANRTEQPWWQDYIEPFRDSPGSVLKVEFLPGRFRFLRPGQTQTRPNERPPFGCLLAIWNWNCGPEPEPMLF